VGHRSHQPSQLPKPQFLGYLVKRVAKPGAWLADPRVLRICSVSSCISREPEQKHKLWRFNAAGCYDSEDLALSTTPEGEHGQWSRFALALFPVEFKHGRRADVPVAELVGDPCAFPSGPAPEYRLLGYDAVSGWRGRPGTTETPGTWFAWHCSPLSCNGEARKFQTTEDSLLRTADEAFVVAEMFSREEPEPGPYYLYAVYAREPIVAHEPPAACAP
jgi:hypothetical protein